MLPRPLPLVKLFTGSLWADPIKPRALSMSRNCGIWLLLTISPASFLPTSLSTPHPPPTPPSSFRTESETWDTALQGCGYQGLTVVKITWSRLKHKFLGYILTWFWSKGPRLRMWTFIWTLVKSGAAGTAWKSRLSWACWLNTYLWPLAWLDSERDHLEMELWRVSASGRSKETSLSNLPLEAGSTSRLPFQWVAKASTKPREVNVHFASYRQAHLNAFLENAICHNY